MFQQYLVSVLSAFLITGCASSYKGSADVDAIKMGMSDTEALSVVDELSNRKAPGHGICNAHTNRNDQPAKYIAMRGDQLVYASLEAQFVEAKVAGSSVISTYENRADLYSLSLRNIVKARLTYDDTFPHCKGGALTVTLYDGFASSVKVQMDKAEEPRFIAAITKLSPGARLMVGAGF